MAEELSYVILTPHSIRKSRTGGIIARLISRTGLDLARARMFAPSRELAERYAAQIAADAEPAQREAREMIAKYVREQFAPDDHGHRPRALFLVFRGEGAVARIRDTVGHILNERTSGETIRDTFGDYITDHAGRVTYFEPAVLAPQDEASAARDLRLWADYSDADGGFLEGVIQYSPGVQVERTLVLIKPDNFRFPSARPGGVLDVFSRTGLSIICFKVHRMSVAQAEEFYGPVLPFLQEKFRTAIGPQARMALERELGIPLSEEVQARLGDLLGPIYGRSNWENIVQFMAGMRPSDCPPDRRTDPGTEKCIALAYEGVDAVRKIREVLGPTDPAKAPPGSIRREFGQTIMINAAHASDSAENARREMGIIDIGENNFKELIDLYYPPKNR